MGWHVVGALVVVLIVGRIFGHIFIEVALEILSDGGVGVFVEREAGGGVMDEDMGEPDTIVAQPGELLRDFMGDQVKAARIGGETKGLLRPAAHAGCFPFANAVEFEGVGSIVHSLRHASTSGRCRIVLSESFWEYLASSPNPLSERSKQQIMYVGRIVAIGKNKAGRVTALYRVSSRSFPNREAKVLGDKVAILPKPGHENDIFQNPYIAYNCLTQVSCYAVATNGSHTDFVTEKLAAGMGPRDALITVMHAMDYEHDQLNTPRISAIVCRQSGKGWLGIVTHQSLHVQEFALEPGTAYYVATYEQILPSVEQRDEAFDVADAEAACQYIIGQGVFADFERPITAACAVEAAAGGFDIAIADATA